jgi:hypothetical protein
MLWGEGHGRNHHMETPQPCNQKQREVFARMLTQAKEHAQAEFELEGHAGQETEDVLLTKLAAERGATEQIAQVRRLRQEVEDAEGKLERLGFDCSGEAISLKWNAPKSLRQSLEAAKRSARKERDKALRKFDLGILGVWAAENADDARKIVEELL